MRYLFWTVLVLVTLLASVTPVEAAVTKTTVGSITEIQVPFEVLPFTMAICENRFMDTNTVWWKDGLFWRQALDEEISGTCEDGISFECSSQVVVNARDTSTMTGICRFASSEGQAWQKIFHWTSARGETRAGFERWN